MPVNLSGQAIVRHSILNLIGLTLPLIVGLITIPHILQGIGVERFGLLTIAWSILGYMGLFDLGLSRALTNLLAERIVMGQLDERSDIIWTTLIGMACLAAIGCGLLLAISGPMLTSLIGVSPEMVGETILSLKIIALALPATILSTGLKGLLEAHQCFQYTNAIQILLGISTFVMPLIAVVYYKSLVPIIALIAAARYGILVIYFYAALKTEPALRVFKPLNLIQLRRQVSYGGWVTVSTIIGPVMVYFDRFVIASVLSVSVVAYYTIPYEVVSRISLISLAISSALFPALSAAFAIDRTQAITIFDRGLRYTLLMVFPVVFVLFGLTKAGLALWLNQDFAFKSTAIAHWLLAGIFLNCLAFIPYSFIQAKRRPDITAKIHLIELPFYILALIWFLKNEGVSGAAITWSLRASVDSVLLFFMTYKLIPETSKTITHNGLITGLCLIALLPMLTLAYSPYLWYYMAFVLGSFFVLAWFFMLTDRERSVIRDIALRFFRT
jgi:O-antigen/teichoic acid export membrane protein